MAEPLARPSAATNSPATRLCYRLTGFVEANRMGVVLVESGFILHRSPDPLAPGLAVEICSPDDREAAEKVANS